MKFYKTFDTLFFEIDGKIESTKLRLS